MSSATSRTVRRAESCSAVRVAKSERIASFAERGEPFDEVVSQVLVQSVLNLINLDGRHRESGGSRTTAAVKRAKSAACQQ